MTDIERLKYELDDLCGAAGIDDGFDHIIELTRQFGFTIVPREPTPEMKKAGENEVVCHSWSNDGEHIDAQSAGDVYKAMIATWEKENQK